MTGEFAIAVHALVYLNHKASTVSSAVLARNVCTNPARIRKVMAKLKNAGIVVTKVGAEGGYFLEKSASEVTLRQVIDAVEIAVVSSSWQTGDALINCMIANGMVDVMNKIYSELDSLCRKRLEKITIEDIQHCISKEEKV